MPSRYPLLLLALSSFACAPSEDDFATAVVTSALQAPQAQQITDDVTHEPCGTLSAADAAAEAAARPTVLLSPADCVEKSAEGETLHVEFDRCTGPFGRVELTGGIEADFEVTGECRLRATVADQGLTANGRPLDYQATADIAVTDGAHLIDWNARVTGTTRRGRTVEQTSSLHVVLDRDTSCRTFDGTTDGSVDTFEYDWSATGMAVCPGECPSSGVIDAAWHRGRRDREFHIAFDGSNVAHVTMPSGRTRDVALVCEAAEAE